MKTKRIFALLLAALMIVGLFAGCSKDETKDPGKTDPGNSLICLLYTSDAADE